MQIPLKRFTFHVNDKLIKSIFSIALSQKPLPNIHKWIALVCHGLTGFFFYVLTTLQLFRYALDALTFAAPFWLSCRAQEWYYHSPLSLSIGFMAKFDEFSDLGKIRCGWYAYVLSTMQK
jgi:hypothetical protein